MQISATVRAVLDGEIFAPADDTPVEEPGTRVTRTQAGESWDLWSVEDGRRIGFLSVVDDGHVVYALSTVKRGTSHEEVADLVEGFFTPSSTDAHNREIIISDYDEEPEMLESDIRQA